MRKESIKKSGLRIFLEIGLLLLSLGMASYFQWEIVNTVFFGLFLVLLLHPISSRFPAFGAIILLITTAILLAIKKEDWAETSAIWAYYLMIFTAVMAFFELHEEKDNGIINKN
jgi:TctA family transporter